jgi:hypothetical protein
MGSLARRVRRNRDRRKSRSERAASLAVFGRDRNEPANGQSPRGTLDGRGDARVAPPLARTRYRSAFERALGVGGLQTRLDFVGSSKIGSLEYGDGPDARAPVPQDGPEASGVRHAYRGSRGRRSRPNVPRRVRNSEAGGRARGGWRNGDRRVEHSRCGTREGIDRSRPSASSSPDRERVSVDGFQRCRGSRGGRRSDPARSPCRRSDRQRRWSDLPDATRRVRPSAPSTSRTTRVPPVSRRRSADRTPTSIPVPPRTTPRRAAGDPIRIGAARRGFIRRGFLPSADFYQARISTKRGFLPSADFYQAKCAKSLFASAILCVFSRHWIEAPCRFQASRISSARRFAIGFPRFPRQF